MAPPRMRAASEAQPGIGLQPWQFFLLAGMLAATAVVDRQRPGSRWLASSLSQR